MTPIEPISISGYFFSTILVLMAWGLLRYERIPLGKDLLIGSTRTVIQLILVGYLLQWVFQSNRWYWVMSVLTLMVWVAAWTATQRLGKRSCSSGWLRNGGAIFVGAGFTIFWVTTVVLRIHPWYHPQYLIPLAGMIIGNSMNSAALSQERFQSELRNRRAEVETLLSLGACPSIAAKDARQAAIFAAMIPNINAMMVVGVVSLPGMMTGQILAGQSPVAATGYQIVVMFMLTCAAAITSVLGVRLSMRACFNIAQQLKVE